jgi:hypothetical protein
VARYWGACNDITYQLSKCLVVEKKQARAGRQARCVLRLFISPAGSPVHACVAGQMLLYGISPSCGQGTVPAL